MNKLLAIILLGAASIAHAEEFRCKTSKHVIVIDMHNGQYRYRAWNKPKAITSRPDMQVTGGTAGMGGMDANQHNDWMFRKANVTFLVSDDVHDRESESEPPKNAIGYLSVSIGGVVRESLWCVK